MFVVLGKICFQKSIIHPVESETETYYLIAERSEYIQERLKSNKSEFILKYCKLFKTLKGYEKYQQTYRYGEEESYDGFQLKPFLLNDKSAIRQLKEFSTKYYGKKYEYYTYQFVICNEENIDELIDILKYADGRTKIEVFNNFNFKKEVEVNMINNI